MRLHLVNITPSDHRMTFYDLVNVLYLFGSKRDVCGLNVFQSSLDISVHMLEIEYFLWPSEYLRRPREGYDMRSTGAHPGNTKLPSSNTFLLCHNTQCFNKGQIMLHILLYGVRGCPKDWNQIKNAPLSWIDWNFCGHPPLLLGGEWLLASVTGQRGQTCVVLSLLDLASQKASAYRSEDVHWFEINYLCNESQVAENSRVSSNGDS